MNNAVIFNVKTGRFNYDLKEHRFPKQKGYLGKYYPCIRAKTGEIVWGDY